MPTSKQLILTCLVVFTSTNLRSQAFVDSLLLDFRVNSISVFNDTVFFVTEKGIYFQVNDSSLQEFKPKRKDYCLLAPNNKQLIFLANSLARVDSSGMKTLVKFNEINGTSFISSVCYDNRGSVYVASTQGIIYKMAVAPGWKVDTISTKLGTSVIYELFYEVNERRIWVATQSGIYFSSDSLFQFKKITTVNEPIYSIAKSNSDLYFAGDGKILMRPIFGKKDKFEKKYLCQKKPIRKIFFVGATLWFLCNDMIGKVGNDINQKYSRLEVGPIKSIYATCVAIDPRNNRVFVGTEGKGAFIFYENDLVRNTNCFLCDSLSYSDNRKNKTVKKNVNIGANREFILHWDMKGVPDRVQVFDGKRKLFDSYLSSDEGESPVLTSSQATITIIIMGNRKEQTYWKCSIKCLN